MKKGALITIIVLLILVIGAIVFLLYRNNPSLSQQGTNNNPNQGTNTATGASTSSQLGALAANSDTSEPNDAAATTDTNVVDSTGLS
jgi:hypothetical protein